MALRSALEHESPFGDRTRAASSKTLAPTKKLHLLLDHDGYLPSYAVVTEGKQHESKVAKLQRFTPATVLVFNRGYNDYDWFAELSDQGVSLSRE
jgi:hypothetical protein